MILKSGKNKGKSTEELVLKQPDWVQFFLSKNPGSKVGNELRAHIEFFDQKSFVKNCFGCKALATRSTLYAGNAEDAMYWCEECDPYSLGANQGKLSIVKRYAEALSFVTARCKGSRGEKRDVIKQLGKAKGLPARVGKQAAIDFFRE